MKNLEIIKDLFISMLIVGVIILGLSIFFYEDISLSKVIPQSEEYMMSEQMKEDMEDTTLEEKEEVITKYYIDASDLKKYEKTKEYNKGKKNPFALEATSTENITTGSNAKDNNTTSENSSENFYEDDGTK